MVCVCVSYQHNSKTNYIRNIKFGVLHLYHIQILLGTFHKDREKTMSTGGTQKNFNKLRPMEGISCYRIFAYSN